MEKVGLCMLKCATPAHMHESKTCFSILPKASTIGGAAGKKIIPIEEVKIEGKSMRSHRISENCISILSLLSLLSLCLLSDRHILHKQPFHL
jgi:hypothetical protein